MIDYQNLFGETVPEPVVGRRKRTPKPPQERARFAVGNVRYDRMDVVWVENGETHCVQVTAEQVRKAVLLPGMNGVAHAILPDGPAEPSPATARAPHVRGSATSEAAARRMDRKLAGKRLKVLKDVLFIEGVTDNELVEAFTKKGWSPNTPRARRVELVTDGWLEDSGERRNGSIVWRPTAKAWAWWKEHNDA